MSPQQSQSRQIFTKKLATDALCVLCNNNNNNSNLTCTNNKTISTTPIESTSISALSYAKPGLSQTVQLFNNRKACLLCVGGVLLVVTTSLTLVHCLDSSSAGDKSSSTIDKYNKHINTAIPATTSTTNVSKDLSMVAWLTNFANALLPATSTATATSSTNSAQQTENDNVFFVDPKKANQTTTPTTTTDILRYTPLTTVVIASAYAIVFIVGLIGNSFVVAIVWRSPRMRTVTNYFIANLAIADILVVLNLPANLANNIFIPYYLGKYSCKTVSYLQGVAVSASINTMVAVTLDRFLAICFPMDWHLSRKAARWTIAGIWLFSCSIALPWAIYFDLVPWEGADMSVCLETWTPEVGTFYFIFAHLILCYLFPLCVITLCYLGIWYKIWRRSIPGDRVNDNKLDMIMQKSKLKVVKMMFVVVIIFVISWAPLYAIFIRMKLFGGHLNTWEDDMIRMLLPYAQWLGASNSCINPILYTFFNSKYKRSFKKFISSCLLCRWVGRLPNGRTDSSRSKRNPRKLCKLQDPQFGTLNCTNINNCTYVLDIQLTSISTPSGNMTTAHYPTRFCPTSSSNKNDDEIFKLRPAVRPRSFHNYRYTQGNSTNKDHKSNASSQLMTASESPRMISTKSSEARSCTDRACSDSDTTDAKGIILNPNNSSRLTTTEVISKVVMPNSICHKIDDSSVRIRKEEKLNKTILDTAGGITQKVTHEEPRYKRKLKCGELAKNSDNSSINLHKRHSLDLRLDKDAKKSGLSALQTNKKANNLGRPSKVKLKPLEHLFFNQKQTHSLDFNFNPLNRCDNCLLYQNFRLNRTSIDCEAFVDYNNYKTCCTKRYKTKHESNYSKIESKNKSQKRYMKRVLSAPSSMTSFYEDENEVIPFKQVFCGRDYSYRTNMKMSKHHEEHGVETAQFIEDINLCTKRKTKLKCARQIDEGNLLFGSCKETSPTSSSSDQTLSRMSKNNNEIKNTKTNYVHKEQRKGGKQSIFYEDKVHSSISKSSLVKTSSNFINNVLHRLNSLGNNFNN